MLGPEPVLVGFWLSEEWRFERDGDEVAVPGTVVEVVRVEDAAKPGGFLFVGRVLDAETQAPIGAGCRTSMRWRMRRWWFEKAPGAPLPEELTEAYAVASGPQPTASLDETEDRQ